ncbi:MAG: hypothetical protein MJ016_07560 [Victivallaceae bacterium]|nr:hypothetical protein [Victivallaceae bacterium]
MYKYTIITFIFNHYEIVHEVQNPDPEVEYILVTDDPETTSKTWKIIVDEDLLGPPFEKSFSVRYNVFKYASTDVCVILDGAVAIRKSIDEVVEAFQTDHCDLGIILHTDRDNFIDEYNCWMSFRQYPLEQTKKFFRMISRTKYDLNYRGLFCATMIIKRRCRIISDIDTMTMAFLRYLGPGNDIERLDQTVLTYVVHTFFPETKVFPLSEIILYSNHLLLCDHGKDTMRSAGTTFTEGPQYRYLFNRLVRCFEFADKTTCARLIPKTRHVQYSFVKK